LATRRALAKLIGRRITDQEAKNYLDDESSDYQQMVSLLSQELGVTSLKFQTVTDMVSAISLPKKRLCLECWLGKNNE
jgi:amidophosphoribosyltransferase